MSEVINTKRKEIIDNDILSGNSDQRKFYLKENVKEFKCRKYSSSSFTFSISKFFKPWPHLIATFTGIFFC